MPGKKVYVRTGKVFEAHKKKQVDAARTYVPTNTLQFRSLRISYIGEEGCKMDSTSP